MPEVKIKIRAFPYYETVKDPVTEQDQRVERIARRGDVVDLSEADHERAVRFDAIETEVDAEIAEATDASSVETATVPQLSEWIQESKPTVEETVDAAGDDPDVAAKLLDAENHATGGNPRKGVVDGLNEIINADR
jgi:hypothetical protein